MVRRKAALAAACVVLVGCALIAGCSPSSGPADTTPTAENGGLLIVYPNGGETFSIGDSITIKFDTVDKDNPETGIILTLVDAAGQVAVIDDEEIPVSMKEYGWRIPQSRFVNGALQPFPTGSNFKILISSYNGLYTKIDHSDGTFTIR